MNLLKQIAAGISASCLLGMMMGQEKPLPKPDLAYKCTQLSETTFTCDRTPTRPLNHSEWPMACKLGDTFQDGAGVGFTIYDCAWEGMGSPPNGIERWKLHPKDGQSKPEPPEPVSSLRNCFRPNGYDIKPDPPDVPAVKEPSTEPPNGPACNIIPCGRQATKWCTHTSTGFESPSSIEICADHPPLVNGCADKTRGLWHDQLPEPTTHWYCRKAQTE